MAIWSRYKYKEADYWPLINALRQRNRYRFGALVQEMPEEIPRHTRAFRVPDGVVILSWTEQKNIALQDLVKPMYLVPFFIVYNDQRERLQLQVNRDFIKLKIKVIDEASRYEYRLVGAESVKVKLSEFIQFCNDITREIQEVGRYCWVEPKTIAAYDRQVKRVVMRWLTTVARLPSVQAKEIHAQYVNRWWRGKGSRVGYEAKLEWARKKKFNKNLIGEWNDSISGIL